jgi:hypothetical protein
MARPPYSPAVGPADKVRGRLATRRRDGRPAPEPSRHSAVAHDRSAATVRKASAAGQRPGSSLSPVASTAASTAHAFGSSEPCPARTSRSLPVAPPRPEPTRAVPAAPRPSLSGCRCATGWWAVQPSRSPSGVRLRSRHLVGAVLVLGELGHLGRHRPWRGAGGRRDRGGATRSGRGELPAGLRRLLLHRLHRLAAALGDGQPAREQAKTDHRSPPRLRAELRRCLRRCRDITSTSRSPAPLIGLLCCFPVREE